MEIVEREREGMNDNTPAVTTDWIIYKWKTIAPSILRT